MMDQILHAAFIESAALKKKFVEIYSDMIVSVTDRIVEALKGGKKLILFGNGGSAADAQHIAAEFVNRFKIERPPLPAIALTTDTSILTSISNDYDFSEVFVKQLKALSASGDVAIAISTSGNSPNIIKALETAKNMGVVTILLSGKDGGRAKGMADFEFIVPSSDTPRIQEIHITLGHVLCELIDYKLFAGATG
jgi:D-sedoheptulose 7-phosphate isomerase